MEFSGSPRRVGRGPASEGSGRPAAANRGPPLPGSLGKQRTIFLDFATLRSENRGDLPPINRKNKRNPPERSAEARLRSGPRRRRLGPSTPPSAPARRSKATRRKRAHDAVGTGFERFGPNRYPLPASLNSSAASRERVAAEASLLFFRLLKSDALPLS